MIVRGLGTKHHDASEYATVAIYLPGAKGTAIITRKVHIVDDLSAKALIGIDIIKPEGMVLDLRRNVIIVGLCQELKVPIATHTRKEAQVDITIFSQTRKVIAPHTDARVPVQARRQPL